MSLSERIVSHFVRQGVITVEDEPIYLFGLDQIFFQLLNLITAIVIGLIMGMLPEALLFIVAYIPLRKYAGGWHASTQLYCFLLSTVLIVAALLFIGAVPLTYLALVLLIVPGAIVIFIMSPVANENKPLSKNEHKTYGRKARVILAIILAITAGLAFFKLLNIIACIGTAISTLSIMLILGLIKNNGRQMLDEGLEGDG